MNTDLAPIHEWLAERSYQFIMIILAGSHATGLNDELSDVDIKVVYKQPLTNYVRVIGKTDTVLRSKSLGDVEMWDIQFFLTKLKESNPSVVEWLPPS